MQRSGQRKVKNVNTYEKIYEVAKSIPCGMVATYGQVAALAGNRRLARTVGNALHANPNSAAIPCHRVVNREGKVSEHYAFGGADAQRKKLESEGIVFESDGRINLRKYGVGVGMKVWQNKNTTESDCEI